MSVHNGDGCDSTSTRTLQVPAGAFNITPVTLPAGTVLHSLDDDVTAVARISSVGINAAARRVQWTATATDQVCVDSPTDASADPLDVEPVSGWESNGDDIGASYSRRIGRVYCQPGARARTTGPVT